LGDILPKFGEYEDDNPGQHLFEFHKLMEELNVHHEDVLMKLFMFSLEKMLDSGINLYPIPVFLH
jgi:hypothetical protein